jgi:hypothetical protein
MTDRLIDCRPARRDSGTTSASFHPELLVGEFIMRPRIHVALSPDDQITVSTWSRRMGGGAMIVLVAVGAWQIFNPHFDGGTTANAAERPNDPTCMAWDARASEAIATLVQGNKQDINLKQVGDAIARMRKARRNCQLGWSQLACTDYRAIIGRAAEVDETMSAATMDCGPTTAGVPNVTAHAATR